MVIRRMLILFLVFSPFCGTGACAMNGNSIFCESIPVGTLLDKATVAITVISTDGQILTSELNQGMFESLDAWVPQDYVEEGFYLVVGDGITGDTYDIGRNFSSARLVRTEDRVTVSPGLLKRTRPVLSPKLSWR